MVYLHLKFWEHPVIRWCFRCSFAAPTLEPPFSLHCVMIRSLWVKRWEGHDVPSFQISNTKHPTKSKAKTTWLLGIIIPIENPVKQTRCLSFLFKAWHTFFMLSFNSRNIFSAPPKNYIRFIGLTLSSTLGGFCSIHIMIAQVPILSAKLRSQDRPTISAVLGPLKFDGYHHQASPKLL